MATIDNNTAYEYMIELFYSYICNKIEKRNLTKLNEKFKKLEQVDFIEYMCGEQGFDDEEDALEFGRYIKNYFRIHNKVPDNIPYKNILENVLM
jgi:hypothetical protein